MRREILGLRLSNIITRSSSPNNKRLRLLRFLSETKKSLSQSPNSQSVIKILLILAIVLVFAVKPVSAAWANSSFSKCMNITISNLVSETLNDFPAYINLTWDDDMLSDFTDIRFYNSSCSNDGTAMDFEIENYTASTRAHIWVRIPSLETGTNTISIYYKNNTAVTSGENPEGV